MLPFRAMLSPFGACDSPAPWSLSDMRELHGPWHQALPFDEAAFPFTSIVREALLGGPGDNGQDLESIRLAEGADEADFVYTQRFYDAARDPDSPFQRTYRRFISHLHRQVYSDEEQFIFQTSPSIRLQFPGRKTLWFHADADEEGRHPLGELNFIVPLTAMRDTAALHIETQPGVGDFKPLNVQPGELLRFSGNLCRHGTYVNEENYTRVSLDFRAMESRTYCTYLERNGGTPSVSVAKPGATKHRALAMSVGDYYTLMPHQPLDFDGSMPLFQAKETLLQMRPWFGAEEAAATSEYVMSGGFMTEHTQSARLEAELAELMGIPREGVVLTTSGSTALTLAYMALGVGVGDEVIVPELTMAATANAAAVLGAKVVFADVERDSLTISAALVAPLITERTRAIVHVSLNNRAPHLLELAQFCKEAGIPLVEDAAQSVGVRLDGQHLGTIGDIGTFSLSSPKIISTGQGGFLVTSNASIASKLRIVKNFGRVAAGPEESYAELGINAKFTDLQAVVGLEQLKKLSWRVRHMRAMWARYRKRLEGINGLQMLHPGTEDPGYLPWFHDVYVAGGPEARDSLMDFLQSHRIQTRKMYGVLSEMPAFKNTSAERREMPAAQWGADCGLFLPSATLYDEGVVDLVAGLIRLYFSACGGQTTCPSF